MFVNHLRNTIRLHYDSLFAGNERLISPQLTSSGGCSVSWLIRLHTAVLSILFCATLSAVAQTSGPMVFGALIGGSAADGEGAFFGLLGGASAFICVRLWFARSPGGG